ncbi:small ribosomal subunit biogenesis GTPase RsgA [Solemya velesiana gill symbiont]|uniref:Small ribosomal subunit biogenesis GTPase RsgA n=1 Tax=Solemya velesiana gill symbiont TaxID=1918948 RepID=A0A1T2KS84_9GAMM|nr:small ribosomal subunit biogenesis GTPase RsgA [Solemya velesiana gill symbiont]OOZ35728.1 ribosome small subunit-dependent GTPase A [Solemya velesiana gill symbiont]
MAKRRLSRRQKERIKAIQDRRRQRMETRAEAALHEAEKNEFRPGLVITRYGQNLVVENEQGELIHCLFRQNIGHVVCGDRVVWQPTTEGNGVVTAILDRQTALVRPNFSGEEKPLAANITQLVIVMAPEPPPSQYLVDQYLVAAENIGVKALITLNKSDLLDDASRTKFEDEFSHYASIGYPVILISAKYEHGLDPLLEQLNEETSILVGQSGVGKSSLINALLPDLNIQVGKLSHASGLGKHTTSTTTFYTLSHGGNLIDSPGVRSFRFGDIDRRHLERGFAEFGGYLGHCRFSNCRHDKEPGCALHEAVEAGKIDPQRLKNFQHMLQNLDSTH